MDGTASAGEGGVLWSFVGAGGWISDFGCRISGASEDLADTAGSGSHADAWGGADSGGGGGSGSGFGPCKFLFFCVCLFGVGQPAVRVVETRVLNRQNDE